MAAAAHGDTVSLVGGGCYLAEQRNAVEARSFLSGVVLMPSCAQPSYVPGEGSATDYCFTGAASSSVISVTALKEERRVEKVQPAAQQMTQA